MSIDVEADVKAGLSLTLGRLQVSVDNLTKATHLEKEQRRLAQFPRQLPLFLPFGANTMLDFLGPQAGRFWQVRLLGVVSLNAGNTGFSTFPTNATPIQASNTFAGAGAGSVSLPNGSNITGFTIQMAPAAATVSGVATVTNVAGGTMSYEIVDQTGGGETLTINFPNPLPAASAGVAPTVNVPALVGGGAYSITVYGTTSGTSSPLITAYAGQNVAAPAPGILPAGQARWQFTAVPSWENFSGDQFRINQNEHLLVGCTAVPAGFNGMVVAVINDIKVDAGESITIGG